MFTRNYRIVGIYIKKLNKPEGTTKKWIKIYILYIYRSFLRMYIWIYIYKKYDKSRPSFRRLGQFKQLEKCSVDQSVVVVPHSQLISRLWIKPRPHLKRTHLRSSCGFVCCSAAQADPQRSLGHLIHFVVPQLQSMVFS